MSDQNFDFNKAFGEVQTIHRWFQSGEFSLEEGIQKFRRGMELLEKCMQRVQTAENEFIEIQKKYQSETATDESNELF